VKKLLIILFIAPAASFAQIRIPHFPVDSVTGKIQYHQVFDFPGDDRKKIFDVMYKWFSADGREKNQGTMLDDKDEESIIAVVSCYIAPWQAQLPRPLNGGTQFVLGMEVKDEHVSITLSGFQVKTDNGLVSLEQYRDQIERIASKEPSTTLSNLPELKNYTKNYNDSLSDMLADINLTASDLLRDAQKFVKKARKQQLL
jgi:hypothetical protein